MWPGRASVLQGEKTEENAPGKLDETLRTTKSMCNITLNYLALGKRECFPGMIETLRTEIKVHSGSNHCSLISPSVNCDFNSLAKKKEVRPRRVMGPSRIRSCKKQRDGAAKMLWTNAHPSSDVFEIKTEPLDRYPSVLVFDVHVLPRPPWLGAGLEGQTDPRLGVILGRRELRSLHVE